MDEKETRKVIRAAYAAGYTSGANHYAPDPDGDDESSIYHDNCEPEITEHEEQEIRTLKENGFL